MNVLELPGANVYEHVLPLSLFNMLVVRKSGMEQWMQVLASEEKMHGIGLLCWKPKFIYMLLNFTELYFQVSMIDWNANEV